MWCRQMSQQSSSARRERGTGRQLTPKLLTSVVTSVLLTPRTLVRALVKCAMYESSTRSRIMSGGFRSSCLYDSRYLPASWALCQGESASTGCDHLMDPCRHGAQSAASICTPGRQAD